MSKAKGALSSVKTFLSKLKVKAPWEITGPTSSPEYQEFLPNSLNYRKHAPGSQPMRAMVPQATPETVYDIAYYKRDTRRAGQLVGGQNQYHRVTTVVNLSEPDSALQALENPPTPGTPHRWGKRISLLDNDNNGYT